MNPKRIVVLLCLFAFTAARAEYFDHRNRNLDSLEAILNSHPGPETLYPTIEQLAFGCLQTDPHYCAFLARRLVKECPPYRYLLLASHGAVLLSNHFRGQGQLDSSLFYARKAFAFLEEARTEGYEPRKTDPVALDDAYSRICGTLGNAYCMQEAYDTAIFYYRKALEVFERNQWKESTSLLYQNLGYLYDDLKDYPEAERNYLKGLDVALETGDSLIIAGSRLQLGQFYIGRGKYAKALDCLTAADEYYAKHEDEEFMGRLELLDAFTAVKENQADLYRKLALASFISLFFLIAAMILLFRLKREKKVLADTEKVLEETLEEIPDPQDGNPEIKLNSRELDIIRMLSEGMDSARIAERLCLSKETIKWYRKRLLAKFGVSTSAAVVSEALRRGIIPN